MKILIFLHIFFISSNEGQLKTLLRNLRYYFIKENENAKKLA